MVIQATRVFRRAGLRKFVWLPLCLFVFVACGQSSARIHEGPGEITPLQQKLVEWEQAGGSFDRERLLNRFLLEFSLHPRSAQSQRLPQALGDSIAMALSYDRDVMEISDWNVAASWRQDAMWMIRGMRVRGAEFMEIDRRHYAMPFVITVDLLVYEGIDGPRIIVSNRHQVQSGHPQLIRIP